MSRISPKYSLQISAPIDEVLKKLDEDNVNYEFVQVNPNELNPSQPFTLSDDVETAILDDMNPVWLAENNSIIDGHHKWVKALLDKIPIKAVKINLNEKDAARVLNKIQDIYEYEQARNLEEVESQGAINYYDNNAQSGEGNSNTFLDSLEEDNLALQNEKEAEKNEKTIIGYRKDPLKENSVVGNFFALKPIDGYDKYQIDFSNLLDTQALGVAYKDGQEPVDILAKSWFPHVNFEKLSEQYNVPSINLKNKAIAEKAMKMGYDGIKYGDTLVQGLK
jgi:hypothetical protein